MVASPYVFDPYAPKSSGVPATGADFFGEGTADAPLAPGDPRDQPNPANPGGISDNELARRQLALRNPTYQPTQNRPGATSGFTRDSNGNQIRIVSNPEAERAYEQKLGTVTDLGMSSDRGPLGLPGGGTQQLGFTPPAPPATAQVGGAPLTDNGMTAGSARAAFGKGDQFLDISQTRGAGGAAPRTDETSEDVRSFLNEERARKGSSEAEALLFKARDQIQGQALGIAAGARGGAGARARATDQAIASNASVGARATQDLAVMRAKEDAAQRDRLLNILGLMGGLAGRGDTLGAQYAGYGASLYGQGVGAGVSAEGNASNERNAEANRGETAANRAENARQFDSNVRTRREEREADQPGFLEGVYNFGTKYAPLFL